MKKREPKTVDAEKVSPLSSFDSLGLNLEPEGRFEVGLGPRTIIYGIRRVNPLSIVYSKDFER